MTKKRGIQIEATLQELEALVRKLEDEEVNLETALAAFEDGIKLTRSAQNALKAAEQQVQVLLEESGQPQAEAFSEDDSE